MIKTNADGDIEADEIEVPGIIRDRYGNQWTIPADPASYDELLTDPLMLPKKDPEFHYQFNRLDQITAKVTEGFRPVTREEVGVETVGADIGGSVSTYHQVHDLVLLKIPKVLADRRYAAAKRVADEAVQQILNPPELENANRNERSNDRQRFTKSREPFSADAHVPDMDNFSEPGSIRKG